MAIAQKKELPIPGEVFEVGGCIAFVILPETRIKYKEPIPWIWYAPTLPNLPGKEETWMFQKILAAGIAIAGIDVGESMGNSTGIKQYSFLYSELVTKRGFSKYPTLLARSRGGLMLYNWAAENPKKVAAIAGIYPVVDLLSYPGIEKAAVAYGLSVGQLTKKLKRVNPVSHLKPLAKARVPIMNLHGDIDQTVPVEKNSGEIVRQYKKYGGNITLLIQKGQGHNMWEGFFHSDEFVDFIITHSLNCEKRK
jgi:pimeloyl-ACP methyl ester carboxylesterase